VTDLTAGYYFEGATSPTPPPFIRLERDGRWGVLHTDPLTAAERGMDRMVVEHPRSLLPGGVRGSDLPSDSIHWVIEGKSLTAVVARTGRLIPLWEVFGGDEQALVAVRELLNITRVSQTDPAAASAALRQHFEAVDTSQAGQLLGDLPARVPSPARYAWGCGLVAAAQEEAAAEAGRGRVYRLLLRAARVALYHKFAPYAELVGEQATISPMSALGLEAGTFIAEECALTIEIAAHAVAGRIVGGTEFAGAVEVLRSGCLLTMRRGLDVTKLVRAEPIRLVMRRYRWEQTREKMLAVAALVVLCCGALLQRWWSWLWQRCWLAVDQVTQRLPSVRTQLRTGLAVGCWWLRSLAGRSLEVAWQWWWHSTSVATKLWWRLRRWSWSKLRPHLSRLHQFFNRLLCHQLY